MIFVVLYIKDFSPFFQLSDRNASFRRGQHLKRRGTFLKYDIYNDIKQKRTQANPDTQPLIRCAFCILPMSTITIVEFSK